MLSCVSGMDPDSVDARIRMLFTVKGKFLIDLKIN